MCLRLRKGRQECKKGAPWTTTNRSKFAPHPKRAGELCFLARHNDPLLNPLPRRHFRQHRANTDLKPILSMQALENYITKYCTKMEPAPDELGRRVGDLMKQEGGAEKRASATYIKVLNKVKSHNRDWSAQEIMFHLLKIPGVECTQSFEIAGSTDSFDVEDVLPRSAENTRRRKSR